MEFNAKTLVILGIVVVLIILVYMYKSRESFSPAGEPAKPMSLYNAATMKKIDAEIGDLEDDMNDETPIDSNAVNYKPVPTSQMLKATTGTPYYDSKPLLPKGDSYPNIHMKPTSNTFVDNTNCSSLLISSPGTSKKNGSLDIRQDVPITKDDSCIAWNKSPLEPFPNYCKLC
jgi:hypothetical protein